MKPIQIEVLRLLSSNEIPESDLAEIKRLIIKALSKNIDNAVDNLFEAKEWDEKKIAEWGKQHLRTPYK
jgi:hypothetical protein